MKHQRGFIDLALLDIAENARWYIRYPVAGCVLFVFWWMELHMQVLHDHPFLTQPWMLLWVYCIALLAKEVWLPLLLLLAAVWIWPDDFLDIPFAQMTFGIFGQFFLSCLLVILAVIAGFISYRYQHGDADANA